MFLTSYLCEGHNLTLYATDEIICTSSTIISNNRRSTKGVLRN